MTYNLWSGTLTATIPDLSPVKFVKSFARWEHLAASGGYSYRLGYTC